MHISATRIFWKEQVIYQLTRKTLGTAAGLCVVIQTLVLAWGTITVHNCVCDRTEQRVGWNPREETSTEHGQCRFCWWGTGVFIPWTFTNQDEPVGCSRPQRSLFQRTARMQPYPALNYSNISPALSSSLYKPHTKSVLQEHCCSWERPALLPLLDLLHDLGIKKCICTQEPSWERTSKRDFPHFKYLISQCEQCPF